MSQTILTGNPPIQVTLRRSAQARRMTLRVSRLDGRVTLSMPPGVAERKAVAFARSRENWLRTALSAVPDAHRVQIGSIIPFEGREIVLAEATGRRTVLCGTCLTVSPDRAGIAAVAFLKNAARDRLAAASDRHAAALGLTYGRLTLRDTRSRWGSCTADGGLMYSWRLVMAPPAVLDYVAAHEVAHLAHMDHSPAFWSVVEGLCPDHRPHRRWLKMNGPGLHRYVFTD